MSNGATVVVIEHDLEMIANADFVLDMGPGGGVHGGRIVASGTPDQVADTADSVTGRYLPTTSTPAIVHDTPAAKAFHARRRRCMNTSVRGRLGGSGAAASTLSSLLILFGGAGERGAEPVEVDVVGSIAGNGNGDRTVTLPLVKIGAATP